MLCMCEAPTSLSRIWQLVGFLLLLGPAQGLTLQYYL